MYGKTKPNTYNYFEVPDGEEVDKKLWYVVSPMSQAAGLIAIADVMLYSHPKGYLRTIGRMATVAFPIIAVSATTVLVTNISGSIRRKDGAGNWFIGGFAGGALFGALLRRPFLGFNCGMALGLAMMFRKDMHDTFGEVVIKEVKTNRNNHWTVHRDWSILHDPPKRWTTGKE